MALPNPRQYPATWGGAIQYAAAYFAAGGSANAVYHGGFGPFRRADFQPGGQYAGLVGEGHSGGGGGGTGGGGPGAPSAGGGASGPPQAVMANQPTITGGGAGFSIGAVDNQTVLTAWPGEWEGVDTLSPDTKMPESLSPEAVNWNALEKFGSRCVRRGVLKFSDDRSSVTISGSPLAAAYRAVSIVPLGNADYALYCFADNDGSIGSALSAEPISLHAVSTLPLWGRPVDLRGYPGPKLTLTAPDANTIRVTYDYTNVWSTVAQQKMTCKSVSIRYNIGAGDILYPLELDTIADDDKVRASDSAGRRAGTAAKDRTSWDGASATVDIDVTSQSSGTIVYVSAWAHGLLGTSERSIAARAKA